MSLEGYLVDRKLLRSVTGKMANYVGPTYITALR
jgi:hypothetical protein